MMNIGFYDRGIDAELLAVFQVEFHGCLHYELVDGCQRGRGEPVEGAVESVVLGNGVTVELRKAAQREAIVDRARADRGSPKFLTRMRINERRVCSGVMPWRPASGFFRPRSRSLRTSSTRSACCSRKSAIALQAGVEVDTQILQLEIGEAELGDEEAAHFFFSARSSSRLISQMRSKEALSLW